MIQLERPPLTETRKEWADWFNKVYLVLSAMQVPVKSDATRGDPGDAGRVVFNVDDGNTNLDDGTNWILPDGTTT